MQNILSMLIVAAILVAVDANQGPIFPDQFYCLLGAGTELQGGSSTRVTAWNINPDPDRPNTPAQTTTTVYSSRCIHTTLWAVYRQKLGLQSKPF
jgi:hypothetical protein